jgi:hypothetical protein
MNQLYYRNLSRQQPDGFCLAGCPVLFPGLVQNMLVYAKEYPFKGSYLYQEKNIRPKEGYMQLNFPINPRLIPINRYQAGKPAPDRISGLSARSLRQLAEHTTVEITLK